MLYNNLLLIISIVSLLVTALIVSAFAQSAEKQEKEGINQTMQDISKSANQPIQKANQTTANETGEAVPIQKNVTDLGANITEGAKDVIGKIGEGLEGLTK
jgi:predicted transcriptional regulator